MIIAILRRLLTLFFLLLPCVFAEITLDAQRISYDGINDIISAYGDVVITQFDENNKKQREIRTEKIEYNRKSGLITIHEKSTITEKTGEVLTADSVVMDVKLKNGIIKALSIILKDRARLIAKSGEKKDKIYSLSGASYSPCYENKNCEHPLWDLYADKVVYDTKKQMFTYHNARLRIKGHTILYTPYFAHPSFDVKRKSGFVTPSFYPKSSNGTLIGTPYFFVLSKSQDLKVTPFINFQRRGFVSAEYREAFPYADLAVGGSVLTKSHDKKADEQDLKTRWNINTSIKSYNLDNKRIILDINRASDTTYLLKYPVNKRYSQSFLQRKTNISKLSAEFFDKNYFLQTDGYVFQTPIKETAPLILPHVNLNYTKENVLSGIASFNSDILYLKRSKAMLDINSKTLYRISNKASWTRDIVANNGMLFNVYTGGKIDTYNFTKNDNLKKNYAYPTFENQVSCSYPLKSNMFNGNYSSVWGPVTSISSVRSPHRRDNKLIVNEDSVFNNFDDLSLFEINRYSGIDRVEYGEKFIYGMENTIYKNSENNRRFLNFFIGKMNSFNGDHSATKDTVTRFVIKPTDNMALRVRSVGLPSLEGVKILECGSTIQFKKFNIDCAYFEDKRKNEYRKSDLSEICIAMGYKLTKYWSTSLFQVFNLKKKSGKKNLSHGISFNYKDECFEVGFGIYTSNYRDQDLKPDSGIIFSFAFKNLMSSSSNRSSGQDSHAIIANVD